NTATTAGQAPPSAAAGGIAQPGRRWAGRVTVTVVPSASSTAAPDPSCPRSTPVSPGAYPSPRPASSTRSPTSRPPTRPGPGLKRALQAVLSAAAPASPPGAAVTIGTCSPATPKV